MLSQNSHNHDIAPKGREGEGGENGFPAASIFHGENLEGLPILTDVDKPKIDILVLGGLHMDDFEWASRQYEAIGYVLIAFILDRDAYHWKAIYVKADQLADAVQKTC
ncbi:MAG: hypothetical protein N0A00_02475 [Candidatus Bathyarchaeota archaeon]|nr:hypothetical protein [Candidatus Bathyarchaeota archaeon]